MNKQKKYEVIKGLADHPKTGNKDRAVLIPGCSKRHINRMLQGYSRSGKDFFIHGNRGKKPATAISIEIRQKVIDLYRNKYFEVNFEHYTELLKKNEGISIYVSSVMSVLESEYILSPKATKAKRRRTKQKLKDQKKATKTKKELSSIQVNLVSVDNALSRHPRCAYFVELQQMDATPYEWVHGQVWHLHLAIDDASGIVTGAWFDTQETHLKITTMYLNRSLLIMV